MASDSSSCDARFMAAALALGRKGIGATAENPAVGCVIVAPPDSDRPARIVGRGWTARGGRPHAETIALAQAGPLAAGATAYVTLEPCAHQGHTPPCVDALVVAGVRRVVSALEDPDPRTAGQGHARLRSAGIAVESGVLAGEARRDLAGYLSRVRRGRPWVTVKLALSRDGKIAAARGNVPNRITGPLARARGHLMRARSDAILVGIGTAIADDPELTCRLPGLEDRSPIRVVVDTRLRLPVGSRLVDTLERAPLQVVGGAGAPPGRAKKLREAGVEVVRCGGAAGASGVALVEVLEMLGARGVNRLMVEGGARIAAALVKDGLVDEVALFWGAEAIGADGLDPLGDLPLDRITAAGEFAVRDELPLGADRLIAYERAGRGAEE